MIKNKVHLPGTEFIINQPQNSISKKFPLIIYVHLMMNGTGNSIIVSNFPPGIRVTFSLSTLISILFAMYNKEILLTDYRILGNELLF